MDEVIVPVFSIGPECMDWTMVQDCLFADPRFRHAATGASPSCDRAVVLVAAQHVGVGEVNQWIAGIARPLVLLLSDEEGVFPSELISKHAQVMVQSPKAPGARYEENVVGFLPMGYSPAMREWMAGERCYDNEHAARDFVFLGQVTHARRHNTAAALDLLKAGGHTVDKLETEGFMQGTDQEGYSHRMMHGKVAPAPPGPHTPDTFRFWEALEAGCVPVPEDFAFWKFLTHEFEMATGPTPFEAFAFPFMTTDVEHDEHVTAVRYGAELKSWERHSAIQGSWYKFYKRWLTQEFARHLELHNEPRTVVMVSASPIDAHPSIGMLRTTILSILNQLPNAEIMIMFDGVRPEQDRLKESYFAHIRRINDLCLHDPAWRNVYSCFDGEWRHQANTMKRWMWTVPSVMDRILFVEHDTPFLSREIDWTSVEQMVSTPQSEVDVIRFHFERQIPEVHEYLMKERRSYSNGVQLQMTVQWSQRPHIMLKGLYQAILEMFTESSRTMIEDALYTYVVREVIPLNIGIYSRPGEPMDYTGHLDGRNGETKYEMWV